MSEQHAHDSESDSVRQPSKEVMQRIVEPLFATHSHLADLVDQVMVDEDAVSAVRSDMRKSVDQVDAILQQAKKARISPYIDKDVMDSTVRTLESARRILSGDMPPQLQNFDSAA